MLNILARFFGLDSPPPPPPKRRPTARRARTPAPVPVTPPPAPRVPAAFPLPTFALALRTYIRQWGQHGPRPSPERLDAAAYALGRDYSAFLTALHLTDGPLTRFLVPESDITRPAVDAGMQEKMALACYSELDIWSAAEKIDLRNRTLARQGGRPVPPPLHVPDEVQAALIKRMTEAAARIAKGGSGKGGGVKPKPPEAMGPAEPVMLDPEGGRSRVAGAAESPDEAATDDADGGSPAPKMGGGGKRRDDDAEETATGRHVPPPPSPEDGEPEGGGYGLPRF